MFLCLDTLGGCEARKVTEGINIKTYPNMLDNFCQWVYNGIR